MKLGSGHGDSGGDATNAEVDSDTTTVEFAADATICYGSLVFASPFTASGKFVFDCVSFSLLFTLVCLWVLGISCCFAEHGLVDELFPYV